MLGMLCINTCTKDKEKILITVEWLMFNVPLYIYSI